jgi:hypothetical protein
MMDEPWPLDREQSDIAMAEVSDRRIVLAPPGSGKTEVVAARIENLVQDQGLDPYSELSVVSFSRAAVAALRRRAADRVRVAGLPVRTIDGLAALILSESGESGWEQQSYDRRVDLAVIQLKENGLPVGLEETKHMVVDEVQDVVGRRATLVLELLRCLPETGGFTLLGDPLQAIYDFQLRDEPGGPTHQTFLEETRQLGHVVTIRLRGQYRAATDETRKVAELDRTSPPGSARVKQVRTFVAGVEDYGDLGGIARAIGRWKGTTAVLCRTNGEALVVANVLRHAGVPASLRAAAEELPLVPWIAESLGGIEGSVVKKEMALSLLGSAPCEPEEAWRILKCVEGNFRTSGRLDLVKMASRLAANLVPAELRGGEGDVVVSTIHRAKGLEFDNVVLVNKGDLIPAAATEEEAAVAYVGLTRARQRVIGAIVKVPSPLFLDHATQRWVLGGHQRWMTRAIEVRGVDLDPTWAPADPYLPPVGSQVVAAVSRRFTTMEAPVFELVCDGKIFGRTAKSFGRAMASRLRGPRKSGRPWPDIGGLGVDSLATVVPLPVGSRPLFRIGVRVSGLGTLHWDGAAHA